MTEMDLSLQRDWLKFTCFTCCDKLHTENWIPSPISQLTSQSVQIILRSINLFCDTKSFAAEVLAYDCQIFRSCINKSFVWANYQSKLMQSLCGTVYVLSELLFVKSWYFSISCLSQADVAHVSDFICTSWWLMYVFMFYFFYTVYVVSIYTINK